MYADLLTVTLNKAGIAGPTHLTVRATSLVC